MTEVVELIGNPRPGSRTRILADAATGAIVAGLDQAGVHLTGTVALELAEIVTITFGSRAAPAVAAGMSTEDNDATAALAHDTVRSARLLVVATPTYKGTYTGLLKVFLDQYGHRELGGVVAVPVGIAAAEPHRQSVGRSLSDLLVELGATVPTAPLAVLEKELEDTDRVVGDWSRLAVPALIDALRASPTHQGAQQ